MSKIASEYFILKANVISDYYSDLNELERERSRENNGAVVIQRNVKMYLCRKRYLLMKTNTLEIQRNFKGFLARDNHTKKMIELSTDMNIGFFNYQATMIKRHWKGFRFRRIVLDYSQRKKDLQEIKIQNEETLAKYEERLKQLKIEMQRKAEDEQRKKFNELASNLHHLVSTRTIPGIYNPLNLAEEDKPQIFNADIETHLKSAFKANFRKAKNANKMNSG